MDKIQNFGRLLIARVYGNSSKREVWGRDYVKSFLQQTKIQSILIDYKKKFPKVFNSNSKTFKIKIPKQHKFRQIDIAKNYKEMPKEIPRHYHYMNFKEKFPIVTSLKCFEITKISKEIFNFYFFFVTDRKNKIDYWKLFNCFLWHIFQLLTDHKSFFFQGNITKYFLQFCLKLNILSPFDNARFLHCPYNAWNLKDFFHK